MNSKFFRQLLTEVSAGEMARHSRLNHHVNGMSYLCLHRSEKLTAKIYLMERPENPHSGFLVHPHSHRYAFGSVVLVGSLEHIRFHRVDGEGWHEHTYDPDARKLTRGNEFALKAEVEKHGPGSFYWVDTDEIHTLRLPTTTASVMIGLAQFQDSEETSQLYLPSDDFVRSDERTPTTDEMEALIARCRRLLTVHDEQHDEVKEPA